MSDRLLSTGLATAQLYQSFHTAPLRCFMTVAVSWLTYSFSVFDMNGTTWNEVGGIYIFGGIQSNLWYPKYVGLAESFKNRLTPNHEQWYPAQMLGATHVHAMVVPQAGSRLLIERELIQKLQPPLNTHHR
jgi:hypothetical protein